MLIAAGKVVYDLLAEREKRGDTSTAVLRLEQYYPLPAADLARELAKYPGAEVVIVQDEPKNQGAWPFLALNLPEALADAGRAPGAARHLARRLGVPRHRARRRSTRPSRPTSSRRRSTADRGVCSTAGRGGGSACR